MKTDILAVLVGLAALLFVLLTVAAFVVLFVLLGLAAWHRDWLQAIFWLLCVVVLVHSTKGEKK